jgi:hypothetical protein
MNRRIARKLGMNPGMRALVLGAPPDYLRRLWPDTHTVLSGANEPYPFVQVFAKRRSQVNQFARKVAKCVAPNGLLWVSYPKKTSGAESDLSREIVREVMGGIGWRAVSIVAIDDVWSALRFRPAEVVGRRPQRARSA